MNFHYFFPVVMVALVSCGTPKKKISITDLQMQLGELQNANAYSNSKLEELNSRLFSLQEDVESNRLVLEEVREKTVLRGVQQASIDAKQAEGVKKPVKVVAKVRAHPGGDFRKGLDLFKKKSYDGALIEFEEFEKKYPRNKLAPDAIYWTGEIYYDRKLYERALSKFKRIPEEFPVASKIDAAILKMGFCYLRMGQSGKASAKFKEIIEIYPNSSSALIAKKQLEEIK